MRRNWPESALFEGSVRILFDLVSFVADLYLHRQAAVVRGAALWGLNTVRVKSRICRLHYGFSFDNIFEEGIDADSRRVYQDWTPNVDLCRGRIEWLIKKVREITFLCFD